MGTGMRSREFTYLLVHEVPPLPLHLACGEGPAAAEHERSMRVLEEIDTAAGKAG
ncbi:hypothetical protein ACFTXM_16410 [Streptomyces sp. NPDC056930]|uniref:hypothetical protein n=1 Tax=Streptomyces sp. NPDC056930 TaxID=3345967 RepID=UPI003631099D